MNRDEAYQKLREMYDSRLSNDLESTLSHFAKDATFRICSAEAGNLFPPPTTNADELRAVMGALIEAWEWTGIEKWEPVIDGQRAAVHYVPTVRHRPSGEMVVCEMLDHITFDEDGKVKEFVEFFDTGNLERLMARLG